MPLTSSQQQAVDRAQAANRQLYAENAQRRERIQNVHDKFWADAQKGKARPDRCIQFINELDEAEQEARTTRSKKPCKQ